MKVPDDFEPTNMSMTDDGQEEFLKWISVDDSIKFYPEFFRDELRSPQSGVKYFLNDER